MKRKYEEAEALKKKKEKEKKEKDKKEKERKEKAAKKEKKIESTAKMTKLFSLRSETSNKKKEEADLIANEQLLKEIDSTQTPEKTNQISDTWQKELNPVSAEIENLTSALTSIKDQLNTIELALTVIEKNKSSSKETNNNNRRSFVPPSHEDFASVPGPSSSKETNNNNRRSFGPPSHEDFAAVPGPSSDKEKNIKIQNSRKRSLYGLESSDDESDADEKSKQKHWKRICVESESPDRNNRMSDESEINHSEGDNGRDEEGLWTLKYTKADPDQGIMELIPNSRVYIEEVALLNIQKSQSKQTTFTRLLMENIFVSNALAACTLNGKSTAYTQTWAMKKNFGAMDVQTIKQSMSAFLVKKKNSAIMNQKFLS
uniref:BEN domain-containing protein n=1 Tax=Trichogramma kaykai TaxID=54128 RepID=A0ABD2X693_9HYME